MNTQVREQLAKDLRLIREKTFFISDRLVKAKEAQEQGHIHKAETYDSDALESLKRLRDLVILALTSKDGTRA